MAAVSRALLMASGANRGAFYAGFGGAFDRTGVDFDLMGGVSAGAIASAWFAAGQYDEILESWREATRWRVAPHPVFNSGRRQNVDNLIQRITLRMMNVERARTASTEVLLGAARVVRRRLLRMPETELHVFSSRDARDRDHMGLMVRATGFVPLMNGLRTAVSIDGQRYLDGGLVTRVPIEMIPEGRVDELWVVVCSPHGLKELESRLGAWSRRERLVVVTPTAELPVKRWTLDWARIQDTIAIGVADIEAAISQAAAHDGHVFIGRSAELYRELVLAAAARP